MKYISENIIIIPTTEFVNSWKNILRSKPNFVLLMAKEVLDLLSLTLMDFEIGSTSYMTCFESGIAEGYDHSYPNGMIGVVIADFSPCNRNFMNLMRGSYPTTLPSYYY